METKDERWPDGPLNLNADFTFTFTFIEYNGSNTDKNQQELNEFSSLLINSIISKWANELSVSENRHHLSDCQMGKNSCWLS